MSKSTTGSSQLLRWELPMFDFVLGFSGGPRKQILEINQWQFTATVFGNCQCLISDSLALERWKSTTGSSQLLRGNCRCLISAFWVHARDLEMPKSTTGSSQLLRWELPMFDFTLGGGRRKRKPGNQPLPVRSCCALELPAFDFRFGFTRLPWKDGNQPLAVRNCCQVFDFSLSKSTTGSSQLLRWELQVFDFSFWVHARDLEMSKSTTGSSQLLRWELPMFDFTLGGPAKKTGNQPLPVRSCCALELPAFDFRFGFARLPWKDGNQPLAVRNCCVGTASV